MATKINYQQLIKEALKVLLDVNEADYSQKDIIKLLNTTGFVIAESTFTKLKKQIEAGIHLDPRRAKKYGVPLEKVIKSYLGLAYDATSQQFLPIKEIDVQSLQNKTQEILQQPSVPTQTPPSTSTVFHPGGRWTPSKKIAFLQTAQYEIIEYGVKLESFIQSFDQYGDANYKDYIVQLLEKGVKIKCYILEPGSNISNMYFRDRTTADDKEEDVLKRLPKIKDRLIKMAKELNHLGHSGQVEVYTYNNIPYNHFSSIDLGKPTAKMLVSHYVYGIQRSKVPFLVFSKREHAALYKNYATSLKALVEQAKKVFPVNKKK